MTATPPPDATAAAPPSPPGLAFRHPASLLATWFGAGRLPFAPGTWGSLAALPFAWILVALGGKLALGVATLVVFVVGWWASHVYVTRTGTSDPGAIVIDEVAGQWLTLLAVPLDPVLYAAAFLLFRVADIFKPWPAGWADRKVKGGLGVMLDDVLAAPYSFIGVSAVAYWKGLLM